MSAQISYCPRCHSEVEFLHTGDTATCPVCRFEYKLNTGAGAPPKLPSPALEIGRVLLKIILIMVGIVVLGIAVLFAGCALILGGHSIP